MLAPVVYQLGTALRSMKCESQAMSDHKELAAHSGQCLLLPPRVFCSFLPQTSHPCWLSISACVDTLMHVVQFEECLKRELGVAQKEKAAFIKEFSESDYNAIEAGWKVGPIIYLRPLRSKSCCVRDQMISVVSLHQLSTHAAAVLISRCGRRHSARVKACSSREAEK